MEITQIEGFRGYYLSGIYEGIVLPLGETKSMALDRAIDLVEGEIQRTDARNEFLCAELKKIKKKREKINEK